MNVSDQAADINCTPEELGVSSELIVRDLWKKSDLGPVENGLAISIPAHGAVLYSIK